MNASMSHGFPAQWTTSMARVRSVIRLSASAASMFSVSASQSAKTGIAFWIRMPSTDPMSVAGAVMISSPGSGLTAPIAAWIAPVPESVEKAYLDAVYLREQVLQLADMAGLAPAFFGPVHHLHHRVELLVPITQV